MNTVMPLVARDSPEDLTIDEKLAVQPETSEKI